MNSDILKYMGIVFGLVLVYLIVKNAQGSTDAINALSSANTNAIAALQGRSVTSST